MKNLFDRIFSKAPSEHERRLESIPYLSSSVRIGKGAQGSVFKVMYRGEPACAKTFNRSERFEQEVKMLKLAQKCRHVPKLIKEFPKQNVLIMELIEGKNLYRFLKEESPSTKLIHQICFELALILTKLHLTGVIHNDLKWDNVMISTDKAEEHKVTIIDLGMATLKHQIPYRNASLKDIQMYPWLDPILANNGACSETTDLFALGTLFLKIYKYRKCLIFKQHGKLLQTHQGARVRRIDLLGDNCANCMKQKIAVDYDLIIFMENFDGCFQKYPQNYYQFKQMKLNKEDKKLEETIIPEAKKILEE